MLDNQYPNGISIPIFAEDYYKYYLEQGAFVNHPVYGIYFAEEKLMRENGRSNGICAYSRWTMYLRKSTD